MDDSVFKFFQWKYQPKHLLLFLLVGILLVSYFNQKKTIVALPIFEAPIPVPNYPRVVSLSPHAYIQDNVVNKSQLGITSSMLCASDKVLDIIGCGHSIWLKEERKRYFQEKIASGVLSSEHLTQFEPWQIALLVDLMLSVDLADESLNRYLLNQLELLLNELDDNNLSLWHSRFNKGNEAFIIASVIFEQNSELYHQAFQHYWRSFQAIQLTEGWPEGYNYWINSRALTFVLASSAFLNSSLDKSKQQAMLATLNRVALWHIYMTRPDHRIAAIADEGPRVDLKDESKPVIDMLAKLTGNRLIASYANYIQSIHGADSYYKHHRWLMPLLYDPSIKPLFQAKASLSGFAHYLPLTDIFGKGFYNQVVIRQGWQDSDSYIQFRAGDHFTHHQHNDVGHFSFFKKNLIIGDSATYTDMKSDNRLYYSLRSLSKNTLQLLDKTPENKQPNRFFHKNINAGGQRLPLPTGSEINSKAHWLKLIKKEGELKKSTLIRVVIKERFYLFEFNISAAYFSKEDDRHKKERTNIIRSFLYLVEQDSLIVYDQLFNLAADISPATLLHVKNLPQIIKSNEQAGATTHYLLGEMGDVSLSYLLPEDNQAEWSKGGGLVNQIDYYHQGSLVSESYFDENNIKPWFDNIAHRIKTMASNPGKNVEFLAIISSKSIAKLLQNDAHYVKYSIGSTMVVWCKKTIKNFHLSERKLMEKYNELIVIGTQEMTEITLINGKNSQKVQLQQHTISLDLAKAKWIK